MPARWAECHVLLDPEFGSGEPDSGDKTVPTGCGWMRRAHDVSRSAVARRSSKPRVAEFEAHEFVAELGEEERAEERVVAGRDDGLHA